MIGDWMGSSYASTGVRWDFHLFLDHDGHYERTICCAPEFELQDKGTWQYHEQDKLLALQPDIRDMSHNQLTRWRVLSVNGCEDSNVLLVLREAILASRNLPITLYRVHCNDRGYGTDWKKNLVAPNGLPE